MMADTFPNMLAYMRAETKSTMRTQRAKWGEKNKLCVTRNCTKVTREGVFYYYINISEGIAVMALFNSQPMTMTQMEKIFSELVFGETLPKPTLVKLLKVK